jgi:hypothetical protein
MFSWLYQVLLSFVARFLSWFGISFSTKEVQDVSDTLQVAQKAMKSPQEDAPQGPEESQEPQPYAVDGPQASPMTMP